MPVIRRLLRHYLPPAAVWASAPARWFGEVWPRRLGRVIPVLSGLLVCLVVGTWGTSGLGLDDSTAAFMAPLAGVVAWFVVLVLTIVIDQAAEWLHLTWGSARWTEASDNLRNQALALLQNSALARAHAARQLRRDPEGLLRARHLNALVSRTWPDRRPSRLADLGALPIPDELERLEKLRRASARLSQALPPATARSRSSRPRF